MNEMFFYYYWNIYAVVKSYPTNLYKIVENIKFLQQLFCWLFWVILLKKESKKSQFFNSFVIHN